MQFTIPFDSLNSDISTFTVGTICYKQLSQLIEEFSYFYITKRSPLFKHVQRDLLRETQEISKRDEEQRFAVKMKLTATFPES